MTVNCTDVDFELMVICGIEGIFTDLIVDTKTLPEGIFKYSIRHSDDGENLFCTLEKNVLVNRTGDFFTKEKINILNCNEFIDINNDYEYLDEEISMEKFISLKK